MTVAYIFADGRWFEIQHGEELSFSNQPGVVEIKEKNGNVIGVVAVTATSFVVIADSIPDSELPIQ